MRGREEKERGKDLLKRTSQQNIGCNYQSVEGKVEGKRAEKNILLKNKYGGKISLGGKG